MRENRTYGSEGGGLGKPRPPTPICSRPLGKAFGGLVARLFIRFDDPMTWELGAIELGADVLELL